MKSILSPLLSLAIASFSLVQAAPLDDLSSPDPSVRDKAAAVLRVSFQPIPEFKWTPLLDKLKIGLTSQEVRAILLPYNLTEGGGAGGGGAYTNSFRLDHEWGLVCAFADKDHILFQRKLYHALERVVVPAPKGFTGKWVTYFPNGNTSCEANYQNGKLAGVYVSYNSDGSKCLEEHYHKNGIDSDQIGYHPSGKVSYRVHLKDGKQAGVLTFYDEEGNVTATREP